MESLAASGMHVECILATSDDVASSELAERQGIELLTVSRDVLDAVSDTRTPQGPVAVFAIPDVPTPRRHDQVVLCDVSDPGNVGTIIRTAVALGWDVTLSGSTVDPWSPKVVRATSGSVFRARLGRVADLGVFADLGVSTVATIVGEGEEPTRTSTDPLAILIGSEAGGLPTDLIAAAGSRWTIPMAPGTESLNVAVAAGILMYVCSSESSLGDPRHL
jgi:RNA methyltransferase, TrmH family